MKHDLKITTWREVADSVLLEVTAPEYKFICHTCGKPNNYWSWECQDCDAKSAIAEDEIQQGDV